MEPPFPVPLLVLLGVLAAGSNLLGGALALVRRPPSRHTLVVGLGFSGGFLLAVALLHVLPECLRLTPLALPLVLVGYFLVYVAEHAFAGHAHPTRHEHHGAHPLIGAHLEEDAARPIRPGAASAAAVGLLLHSFFDGAAISAALAARTTLGWLTFLGVVLHKIPEGYSLASIVRGSAGSRRSAFWLAAALGGSSLAGTLATAAVARAAAGWDAVLLSVACGMFLHIAATDLLPTTAHVRGFSVLAATLAGAGAVLVASLLLARALP